MTYVPGIPTGPSKPNQTYTQIATNFTQLNDIFGEDHVPFNDATAADRGKHDKSSYVRQGAAPGSAADELVVYQKNAGAGTSDLYFQRDNVATETRFTGGGITAAAWVKFTIAAGVVTVNASYNVSGVVRNSSNNYTISFTRSFSSANYVPVILSNFQGQVVTRGSLYKFVSQLAGSLRFTVDADVNDPTTINAVFFGELA